jgi:Ca2+-binding EF-hand superfamily protein
LALGEPEVIQLLLLMDTDKNGTISKQEWMNFMEAEFDRLDKDKSGDLDAKDLAQSKLRVSHPVSVGK